jgi:hypothetical protein
MNLDAWAARHHIAPDALLELKQFILPPTNGTVLTGTSEAAVQTIVRLEASEAGGRLWRNNVGAGYLQDGSFIRWGLCNDSVQLNRRVKSPDVVGIMPVRITQRHVGKIIGRFVGREIKESGWKWKATEREIAQEKFHEIVNALGGDSCFATGKGTLEKYRGDPI